MPATLGRTTTLDAGLCGCGGCGFDGDGFGGAASSGFITRGTGGFDSFGGSGKPPTDRASDGRDCTAGLGRPDFFEVT